MDGKVNEGTIPARKKLKKRSGRVGKDGAYSVRKSRFKSQITTLKNDILCKMFIFYKNIVWN